MACDQDKSRWGGNRGGGRSKTDIRATKNPNCISGDQVDGRHMTGRWKVGKNICGGGHGERGNQ